jgi:DNA-binding transcriptional ArsR family regulator
MAGKGKTMRELTESGQLKTFFDRRLIEALGHPVREHILAVLNERIASAREIGEEVGADVSSFYYHVDELEKLGCIERVESRKRRGAKEHFFRAKTSLFFDDAAWQQLPSSFKGDQTASILQHLFDDVVGALNEETFDIRDDRHVSWVPGFFDAQGWDEVVSLMNATAEHLCSIREAAASRLAKADERGIPATMGILAFETPPSAGDRATNERSLSPEKKPRRA